MKFFYSASAPHVGNPYAQSSMGRCCHELTHSQCMQAVGLQELVAQGIALGKKHRYRGNDVYGYMFVARVWFAPKS